jgi:hypothetical protein
MLALSQCSITLILKIKEPGMKILLAGVGSLCTQKMLAQCMLPVLLMR